VRRIDILKLKEIFFNKLGVLIDGDFKFGVLLLVFVRFMCRTKTSKSPHAFAICSIRTDPLKQENEKIDSL
jgi:hypothetical protein